ncbi:MAG: amino acid permease [Polyangia bacterium]
MVSSLFRRKTVDQVLSEAESGGSRLARSLSAFDLTMIGVGAIIGAGIFALTGNAAANKAGPAIMISFILSGLGCAFAGLCYAEMAAMIPVAGSAYTYAYATLGEILAWLIGWALVLEYAVGAITVAISWSGYLVRFLEKGFDVHLPGEWVNGYFASWTDAAGIVHSHGILNVPAIFLVIAVTTLLIVGVKESARATSAIVVVKIIAVLLFLAIGAKYVRTENWTPFMPFGVGGIVAGAGVIFFAYIGFDAVTTMSEEAKNAQRDLPIGIMASLVLCTLLYIAVAAVLTGMVPYTRLADPAPVTLALASVGVKWGVMLVSVGALAGLASVVLVMMMGQPRVFFAMSRDGLLPSSISKVHPRFQTPYRSTMLTGVVVAIFASTLNAQMAGEMTSMGTLLAFALVCIGVMLLRVRDPERRRPFRVPLVWGVAPLGVLICTALVIKLDSFTQKAVGLWMVLGLAVYLAYGRTHSALQHKGK